MKPIESEVIRDMQNGVEVSALAETREDFLKAGFRIVYELGAIIRRNRYSKLVIDVGIKGDGTKQTAVDVEAETRARDLIKNFFPDHSFVGEEFGGSLDPEKYSWVVDPIDGTNSFLSNENTVGVSLALFKNGKVIMSFVYNPFTGELFYTVENDVTRMVVADGIVGDKFAMDMPLPAFGNFENTSVNVHTGDKGLGIYNRLFEAKKGFGIGKIVSHGGSPAYALADVTKGSVAYVNDWGGKPAEPWDLAAGMKLIENTPDGSVVDINGNPISYLRHSGLIVATTSHTFRDKLLGILSK